MSNCCCNNCCCRSGSVINEPFYCPRLQTYVIRGPRGATGPQGPQGPQGLNGTITNNATLFQNTAVSVASNGFVPFASNVVLNGTKITHVSGSSSVVLAPGAYLVVWSASDVVGETANATTLGLSINGVSNTLTSSTITPTANTTASISGNSIVVVPTTSTLSLQNLSAETADLSNVTMSIVNLT